MYLSILLVDKACFGRYHNRNNLKNLPIYFRMDGPKVSTATPQS